MARNGQSAELKAMRVAARAVGTMRTGTNRVTTVIRRAGFPYRAPTIPRTLDVPPKPKKVGADFDTEWARKPPARYARAAIIEGPLRLAIRGVAAPEIVGTDRLADLLAAEEPGPVIFAANHQSHLDAPLMLTSVPMPWRHKVVVGAAADYFFGTRVTSVASALALNAIPIDRSKVNRRSADLATSLIEDGWSLLIFPEGGRSPDGWGQPFRGGAAFLSVRTGVPVIPVHIDGAGSIWGKGAKRIKPGTTKITFGAPLLPGEDDARRFGDRIEHAVAVLGDESLTDWYSARLRSASGKTPSLQGPGATGWRRAWALAEHRSRGKTGQRRRQKRTWPKMD
ncbi:MAG TPA: lysophospholipid acyltransferase family protein [Acidimicrobiales bacterium]